MKKLLLLIISTLLFFNTAYSAQTRTVEKSNIDEAWKVDGKFIKAECFDYIWVSGDRYETFFDEYFKKPEGSHWDEPKFLKFTDEVGMYLNKEVPLNHFVNTGWESDPKISLTKQLEGCLSEKPETFVRFTDGTSNTIGYKVVHNFDPYFAKELAPYIDQKFESVKQVEIEEWGGGSMPPQTHMVVFGVLELEGKKVLLPLRNKSILTEIGKRDSFFEGNGRYSYEAEFDLNDDITKIININDFKQMVSDDGCFKINDFARDGKIYDFLNKNKLKTYCNEVRPFDDIDWLLKQREFEDSQDLIFDDKKYRFSNLIRSQVPDIQVPWVDYSLRLGEALIESIWFNGDIQYLKNRQQVVVTGCVYKFCSQKGFIFAYKDNFIGLIQHGNEEFDKEDFLVFSKKHKNLADLPDDFFAAVKEWINKTNTSYGFIVIEPTTVRFLGSDNKIKKAKNLFVSNKSNINCIAGDCVNGIGTFKYKDGSKYTGKFKNGKRHGQGSLEMSNGTVYTGLSKADVFSGEGTILYSSGDKYVGEIQNNKRNGQGAYTFANGLTSIGEWKDNKTVGSHTIADPEKVGEKAVEKIIEEKNKKKINKKASKVKSKEVNLSCDISKFFTRKYMLDDEKQIPLSKLQPSYLKKVTLSFDMDNEKFLGSNLIYPNEYKSVLFSQIEDVIYFMTKGFKNNEDIYYFDTRLNRMTGELTRVTRVTESYVKSKLKTPDADTGWGWQQTEVYQCKEVDKLF